jgi:acyl dehydratase
VTDLIPAEALAMIGTELEHRTGVVIRKEFQRWAAAVRDLNPLYFDPDFACQHGYRDVIMPPLFLPHVITGVADLDELRPDGIPAIAPAGKVPLTTPRRMAGGEDTTFAGPVYPDDAITAVRVLTGLAHKHGRSGEFVVLSWQVTYTNQDGAIVARTDGTTIAR